MFKILVADNYNIHRIGLTQILIEAFPGAIVEEANDVDSLLHKSRTNHWDLIIDGFILPVDKGIDTLEKVKKTDPAVPVAVCGLEIRKETIACLLNAGAISFIDKASKASSIIQQVREMQSLKK